MAHNRDYTNNSKTTLFIHKSNFMTTLPYIYHHSLSTDCVHAYEVHPDIFHNFNLVEEIQNSMEHSHFIIFYHSISEAYYSNFKCHLVFHFCFKLFFLLEVFLPWPWSSNLLPIISI